MSVFLDAIKVLEERGWHQGAAQGDDGSVCLMGACAHGAVRAGRLHGWLTESEHDALVSVTPGRKAARFNDDPSTSYEDVILLLKEAHEAWESR